MGDRGPGIRGPRRLLLAALFLLVLVTLVWRVRSGPAPPPRVDYTRFFSWLEEGKVERVTLRDRSIDGELKQEEFADEKRLKEFRTTIPENDEQLIATMRERGVHLRVEDDEDSLLITIIVGLLPWVLIIGLWIWLSRGARKFMASGSPFGMLRSKSRRFDRSTSVSVTFEDVAGLGPAKRDLLEVVEFLRDPARFRRLAAKVPRGVLLIGPPGTGKTLLARAVAGESGVPFFTISGSEFIELFVGVGAARVRDLFAEAKRDAPAIVFIDEIDAVGRARGSGFGGGHDEREQTLNQLLSEMDGFERSDMIVVLAATNRPDVLDSALLRPGRFDRRVIVDRPEREARAAILLVHTRDMPISADLNLEAITSATAGFSGADLANLANEAALSALRRDADRIEEKDFWIAFDKVVLGDPREAKLDETERRRVAVHESGHAVTAWFAPGSEPPQRVSIIPRGLSLGATQQLPTGDQHLMTQSQLEAKLLVLMSGYAAERVVLGEVSTGSENDLREATELAAKMVSHYGMSSELGPCYFEQSEEHPFLGRKVATEGGSSDATIFAVESETRKVLRTAEERATALLKEHREALDRLTHQLLSSETLEREQVAEVLGKAKEDSSPG